MNWWHDIVIPGAVGFLALVVGVIVWVVMDSDL